MKPKSGRSFRSALYDVYWILMPYVHTVCTMYLCAGTKLSANNFSGIQEGRYFDRWKPRLYQILGNNPSSGPLEPRSCLYPLSPIIANINVKARFTNISTVRYLISIRYSKMASIIPNMPRSAHQTTLNRIATERSIRHLGSAFVRLDALSFSRSRELDTSNVKPLERLFREEKGCRPYDSPNRIPAVINEAELHQLVPASELAAGRLLPPSGNLAKINFPHGTFFPTQESIFRKKMVGTAKRSI